MKSINMFEFTSIVKVWAWLRSHFSWLPCPMYFHEKQEMITVICFYRCFFKLVSGSM